MLIAREMTSPATPSDTHASTIMSSLAHRLTAETSVGLNAVAAPVLDRAGEVIAALSVSGPSYRLTEERLATLIEPLKAGAAEISRKMGWFGE